MVEVQVEFKQHKIQDLPNQAGYPVKDTKYLMNIKLINNYIIESDYKVQERPTQICGLV